MTQHNKRTLKSFGQVPFDVVCHRTYIRAAGERAGSPSRTPPQPLSADLDNDGGDNNRSIPELADAPDTEDVDAVITLGDLLRQCDLDTDPEAIGPAQQKNDAETDAASARLANLLASATYPWRLSHVLYEVAYLKTRSIFST
ncbi:hypothetical protein BDZ89DRAFT_1149036 [Hymenopellis radicata]|nr:hypothetical protein BDZ89DRAFT_1149036 [Hymenopellis radicata]